MNATAYRSMMPTTRAAHERLQADLEARRASDHKAQIDPFLARWDEPPCTLDEAREHLSDTAFDAAEAIMCGRSWTDAINTNRDIHEA